MRKTTTRMVRKATARRVSRALVPAVFSLLSAGLSLGEELEILQDEHCPVYDPWGRLLLKDQNGRLRAVVLQLSTV